MGREIWTVTSRICQNNVIKFWKDSEKIHFFSNFFRMNRGDHIKQNFPKKNFFSKKCRKLFEMVKNDCSSFETEFEHRLPYFYWDFPQKLYWKTRKMKIYPNFRDLWPFSLWFLASGGQNVPACKFLENSQRLSKVTSLVI